MCPTFRWPAALSALVLTLLWGALLTRHLVRVSRPSRSSGSPSPVAQSRKPNKRLLESYTRLPLSFEANRGQFPKPAQFVARGRGYSLALTPREAILCLQRGGTAGDSRQVSRPGRAGRRSARRQGPAESVALRLKLLQANPAPNAAAERPLPGKVNYFLGNDPKQWCANVPTYGRVRYGQVYPGIDLTYYGSQRQLEYDFVVAPGADPDRIRFRVEGARKVEINRGGDLVLHTAGGDVVQHAPVTYQVIDGRRMPVQSRYVLAASARQVGFRLGAYDRSRTLVIDPILSYSTYLGGTGSDIGYGIAVDAAGSAYLAGATVSPDFPERNELQGPRGGHEAFVAKLSVDGRSLIYATYLGGTGDDDGHSVAVDSAGNAYVTGGTTSADFPTAHAFQPQKGGAAGVYTAFVTKLDPSGANLAFSTYLGGTGQGETGYGIAVDTAGAAYVTGFTGSKDFPTTPGSFQPAQGGGAQNAFVTKFSPSGGLAYSSYLGGNGSTDTAFGIAVDPSGNAYVAGQTGSSNFPLRNPLQSTFATGFVTEVSASGASLVYSTYLGGSGFGICAGVAVDGSGNAYVTGYTTARDFPTTPQAFQRTGDGGRGDAFAAKISTGGAALAYSTYLSGTGLDFGHGIAVDTADSAYVTGYTTAADFPTREPLQSPQGGSYAFVTKLDAAGLPSYSTLLGGATGGHEQGLAIAVDVSGNAYVTGSTGSADFPLMNPVQSALAGSTDVYVAKLSAGSGPPPPPPATHFSLTAPATAAAGDPFSFTLTALDAANTPVPGYTGTVHFTSSDAQAALPADYTFTAGDNGAHTFSGTLKTAGPQTLTATDTAKPALKGSAPVTVNAGAAADLRFGQQPTNAAPKAVIAPPVTVRIVDAFGNTVTSANNTVTLELGANPGGGTLSGTTSVAAVNGIATFNNLSVDKAGTGYTLAPSADGLPGPFAASAPFNITAKPATHFRLTAPATASSGEAFNVTATALDADNQPVTGYTGAVHWTSSDSQAGLPTDYVFTAGDAGTHVFSITLKTIGSKTVTVTDKATASITGTATVNVTEPVSFVVTTNLDTVSASDGVTSLREAINAANAHAGLDTITFRIPGSGLKSIAPTTPLPTVTDPVVIDGYTQPGAKVNTAPSFATNAVPLIEISGSKAGKGVNGLTITVGGSTVKGLAINRFQAAANGTQGAGIVLKSAGGNTIAGCFLGTSNSGTAALGNATGVLVEECPNNTIGGSTPAATNLVSGNGTGVDVEGDAAAHNVVLGCVLGTNAAGTAALKSSVGVDLEGLDNQIGPGNLISGHTGTGVFVLAFVPGRVASGNTIIGNRVGTDVTGTKAIANSSGIDLANGATRTRVGGTTTAARNVISGNRTGVNIYSGIGGNAAPSLNVVLGNYVGTDTFGTKALPNATSGISISSGAHDNVIGGDVPGARNVISGNKSNGIFLTGATTSSNQVQGNYIGMDVTGNKPLSNGSTGIEVEAPNTVIGGTTVGARNVISGNPTWGVRVSTNSTGTVIQGNYVGTNAAGTAAFGAAEGVNLVTSSGCLVGGATPGAGNLISGNGAGVLIFNASAGTVQGNLIGTNPAGTGAIPNTTGVGIIAGSKNNLIGGDVPGARNVISGNKTNGIRIADVGSTGNQIQGNYIGVRADGASALPNLADGMVIEAGVLGTLVGGTTSATRNVISGNTLRNVNVQGSNTTVQGNYIGTDASGTVAADKSSSSFGVLAYGQNNLIGGAVPGAGNLISGNGEGIGAAGVGTVIQGNRIGTDRTGIIALPNNVGIGTAGATVLIGGIQAGAGNLISGNTVYGVEVFGAGHVLQGNYVGTNAAGTAPLPNLNTGILLEANTASVTVGGDAPGAGNVISGNGKFGVTITSNTNKVQGNYIGTNAAGTAAVPNALAGISITSSGNTIGGTPPGAGNLISGNATNGVELSGKLATGNVVLGNRIGTDASGTLALGNKSNGVVLGGSGNTIGGPAAGAGNLISGQGGAGILFFSDVQKNVVQGNFIGTNLAGTLPAPNGIGIVFTTGSANQALNTVGGITPGTGNRIAFNKEQGIYVGNGTRNALRGNAIFGNGKLGIDLISPGQATSGVTPNDALDKDNGPNGLQNSPVMTDTSLPGTPALTVKLNSTPRTVFVIDLYRSTNADPSGSGEGEAYVGSRTVTTDAAGNATILINPPPSDAGQYYTATASRDYGAGVFETSEFSNAVRVPGP